MRGARGQRNASQGQTLVLFALSLVVLLAGLAVILDGGRVYTERRITQNAADAAAMAGAAKLVAGDPVGSVDAVLAAACAAAYANGGFGDGTPGPQCGLGGTVVNVHVPGGDGSTTPLANVYAKFENPGYVQVEITSSFRSFMAGLVGLSDFAASALGVAVNLPGNGVGDTLLVLDPVDCGALTLNGTNVLNVSGGNVMVNSSAAKSADTYCTNKNAAIKSGSGTGGLNNLSGSNNIVGNGDPENITPAWTKADYKPDPLTRVTVPPFDNTKLSPAGPGTWDKPAPWTAMGTAVANPGVYWGGITVTTGDTLTLSSGTYIMAGGGFNLQGGTVTGTAVTIIYTRDPYCNSTAASPPAACTTPVKKNGNLDGSHLDGGTSSVGQTGGSWGTPGAALTAQAPSPDPYNLTSILIYVDRNALAQSGADPCPATQLNVGGNGYFNFKTGSIIYAPCGSVKLHGTSDPASHGGAVIAWQVTIDGTKDLDLGGPAVGGEPFSQSNLVQ